MCTIIGHHHISMIAKDAKVNNFFYSEILGLRRVKVTVNQDDPSMYHLFYGDLIGSPGTALTFFVMPSVGRTYQGTNGFTRIGLFVPSEESLIFWKRRFEQFHVKHGNITTYAKRKALHFEDRDGLKMVLLVGKDRQLRDFRAWEKSPVPLEYQIQGIGPVEIQVRRLEKLRRTFTELLGYEIIYQTNEEVVFQSIKGGGVSEVIARLLDGRRERLGPGSIHHLALRVEDEEDLKYFDEEVQRRGLYSSGIVDRFYFKSLYFRESNGMIFEIATDGPGFTIDHDLEALGEQLDLPPFLEGKRAEIEAKLPSIEEF